MTEPPNPPHWQEAMDRAGLGSRTALGIAAGVPTTTVTGLITGERRSSERTMRAVADALRVDVTTVREWAALARGEQEPYQPPVEANRLNRRQRRALDELIRSIVAAHEDREQHPGGRLVDLARPPMPDLSRVAARRGRSEARRRREEQDRDAEDPQQQPPHE